MAKFFKPSKKILNGLSYYGLLALQRTIAIFPPRVTRFFMKGLFAIAFVGLKGVKGICVQNLRSVYGETKSEREYDSMANDILSNIGFGMFDLIYYLNRRQKLTAQSVVNYEERLKEALKSGRGVISISGHMGNFPLLFVILTQRGYKINVVIRPMRDNDFSEFMHRLCAQGSINMIQTLPPKQFYKECMRVLKANELLFFLLDEFVPDGIPAKFFNGTVLRSPGPLLFQKRLDSPVVPIFIVKDKQQKFQVFVEPALAVQKNLSPDANDVQNISSLNAVIESYVKGYPLQWGGWLNKKWRTAMLASGKG